MENVWRIEERL